MQLQQRQCHDALFTHFTDAGHKIFSDALSNVLDKGADGKTRAWSNPKSTAGGEFKYPKSFERNGTVGCPVYVANKAKGHSTVTHTISALKPCCSRKIRTRSCPI